VRLTFVDVVGKGHVRLRLQGGDGSRISAIAFRAAGTALGEALLRARGERIHAAGVLRANRWNGRTEAQLHIEDAAAAA
jgi:single-stranded-DNA-specific exonuclease